MSRATYPDGELFCGALIWLGNVRLECDRVEGHDGDHGGVYGGSNDTYTGIVDVHASWQRS